MSRTHIVYRAYGIHNELLYVGMTAQPGIRLRKHAENKDWWLEVHRIDLAHYRNREAAERAEQRAIAIELPLYNVQYSKPEELAQIRELREELYGDEEYLYDADGEPYEHDWVLVEYTGPEVDCTDMAPIDPLSGVSA